MRKSLAVICSLALAASVLVVPAKANDDLGYFLGGVVGGLVLGEVTRPHRHVERDYYYDEPVYEKQCYTKVTRRYDPVYDRYVKVKRRVCEWIRVD